MNRHKLGWLWPLLIILLLILFGLWLLGGRVREMGGLPEGSPAQTAAEPVETDGDWKLVLVNRDHRLPRNWQVELEELDNGQRVDSRIYPDLQAMFDDARYDGLELFVAAGYRTAAEQQALLEEKIEEYRAEGRSRREAKELAGQWVARPGASEHQLGIAVDINADSDYSSSEALYQWLEDNSWKYGFIHRYPADKTEITGIVNEPWHYRYVGYEAAAAMYDSGQCLEEYLAAQGLP